MLPGTLKAVEPILTLAMVDYDSLAHHTAPRDYFPAHASETVSPTEAAKTIALENSFRPLTLSLEKLPQRRFVSPLFQTGRYLTERGYSKFWSCVQAGYGEIFANKSPIIYGHNFEEPSCGYLKFCFHF
jgi:hypothetical protein